jgi:hypothetical protein
MKKTLALLSLTLCSTLLSVSSAQRIVKTPLQLQDLAQVLGHFEALELNLPAAARSFILSTPGARLSGNTEAGVKRAVAGVSSFALQTCQDSTKIGAFISFNNGQTSSWSCVPKPEGTLTPAFRAVRLGDARKGEVNLTLNRWVPLWAYIPNLRVFPSSIEVTSPGSWILWQIYISDKELVSLTDVPEPPKYKSGEITLF